MGLAQVAFLIQVRHDVADGSGTEAIAAPPRDGSRSDRLTGLDISFDDFVKKLAIPRNHLKCTLL
jgi:hypothetical protein